MFQVPRSSSPPSTPSLEHKRHQPNAFAAAGTPSGGGAPPPLPLDLTTTPAGAPPSSVFGSLRYDSLKSFPAVAAVSFNTLDSSPQALFTETLSREEAYDAMEEDNDFNTSHNRVTYRGDALDIRYLAKSLAQTLPQLEEPDELVLDTENILERLHTRSRTDAHGLDGLEPALVAAATELVKTWEMGYAPQSAEGLIGPRSDASPIAKAAFLATLQLALYHQPRRSQSSGALRSSASRSSPQPIPGVLVEWLRDSHRPYPQDVEDLFDSDQDPCADVKYWDTIYACTVRGQLDDTIELLRGANFEYALTAQDDGSSEPGYHGRQLGNVQRVINRAVQLLESCPSVQGKNWNTKSADWAIFRKRVHQAVSDLETFAEGSSHDREPSHYAPLQAEHFGMNDIRNDALSVHGMSQRVESQVPWSIYQNLKAMYGILLGTSSEIVASSADWVEATLGLTIWWDGGDEMSKQLTVNRRSLNKSQPPRFSEGDAATSYRQRLTASFQAVVKGNDDAELQVNPRNPVEVALACVFMNDVENLIGILRGLSNTVSVAVTEIAGLGKWLGDSFTPRKLPKGFDESDLMVLSWAQKDTGVKRDDILCHYARLLARRPIFTHSRKRTRSEGWELALQVLGRLDNTESANDRMAQILDQLDVTTAARVEKVFGACSQFGLADLGRRVSEKYADHLCGSTNEYGNALYYYSRAHCVQKLRHVANMLIAMCVVQSMAFPRASELDSTMRALLDSPIQTLARLDRTDHIAAGYLSVHVSGYAIVRKIYDLRDQGIIQQGAELERLRSNLRRKAMGTALVAAITSASDSIHGGLYDASVDSVVPIDVLLSLMGETLVFINQPKRVMTTSQIVAILRAVEDLSTGPAHILKQCEDCFQSTMTQSRGFEVPSSEALLRMSMSSMTASSHFSLIDSAMLKLQAGSAPETSGVLVRHKVLRAWDWRSGLAANATGQDLLKILRSGLAKEMAQAWTAES